ncbi:hypothetical protein [Methanoregula sp.]|uniref:hypothetical protein n=1 Tax=Methanoregula sp. TaxID=2052170 RepID=UPI002C6F042A|nr:hypothetical protein [Methanoregula sp.]HVP95892.1 hypothetical protein [Methanoregula sp.]
MDKAAGTDPQHRNDAGSTPLCKAPSHDVKGVLAGHEVEGDPGKEECNIVMGPEEIAAQHGTGIFFSGHTWFLVCGSGERDGIFCSGEIT